MANEFDHSGQTPALRTYEVKVYDVFNNTHTFIVATKEKGREYAKRIITEGLWFDDGSGEVFYPVHNVVKVVIS